MTAKTPVLDVLIARDRDAWRLYFAPGSWVPGFLGPVDTSTIIQSISPVSRPDLDDLELFARETDSPCERRASADGGVEIRASGRSAITLAVWLEELVRKAEEETAVRKEGERVAALTDAELDAELAAWGIDPKAARARGAALAAKLLAKRVPK